MNSTTPNPTGNHQKDTLFAAGFLVLAGIVSGVVLYGNWWQENQLFSDYEVRLDRSVEKYEQLISDNDVTAKQIYLQGAEIDVISRRIGEHLDSPEQVWQRLQFLNQHANRLDSVYASTEHWNEPTKLSTELGEIQRRINGYRERVAELTEDLAQTESCYGLLARIEQVKTAIVHTRFSADGSDQATFQNWLDQCLGILSELPGLASESRSSDLNPDGVGVVFKRGALTSFWLAAQIGEAGSLEKVESQLKLCVDAIADPPGSLRLIAQDLETIVAMVRLTLVLGERSKESSPRSEEAIKNAFKQFDRAFRFRPDKTSDVMTHVMDLQCLAVKADWQPISQKLTELQTKDLSNTLRLDASEMRFLRDQTAATIWLCLSSDAWLDRVDSKLKIENGLKLAFSLGYGSDETQRGLLAIGNARARGLPETKSGGTFLDLPKVDPRLVDAATVSPSSPWSLITAAIAAVIDKDEDGFRNFVDNASMLNVELGDSLVRLSIWRAFDTKTPTPAEADAWLLMTELLYQSMNEGATFSGPDAKLLMQQTGNLFLARAAWQSIAGQRTAALETLEQASAKVGEMPLYFQIEGFVTSRNRGGKSSK